MVLRNVPKDERVRAYHLLTGMETKAVRRSSDPTQASRTANRGPATGGPNVEGNAGRVGLRLQPLPGRACERWRRVEGTDGGSVTGGEIMNKLARLPAKVHQTRASTKKRNTELSMAQRMARSAMQPPNPAVSTENFANHAGLSDELPIRSCECRHTGDRKIMGLPPFAGKQKHMGSMTQ